MKVKIINPVNYNSKQTNFKGVKTIAGITVPVSDVLIKPKAKVLLAAAAFSSAVSGILFDLKQEYLVRSGKIFNSDAKTTNNGELYEYDENGKLELYHKLSKDTEGHTVINDVNFHDNGLISRSSTKVFSKEVMDSNKGSYTATSITYRKDGTRESVEETNGEIINRDDIILKEKRSKIETVNFKNDGITVDSFVSLRNYHKNADIRTVGVIKEADDKTVRQNIDKVENLVSFLA